MKTLSESSPSLSSDSPQVKCIACGHGNGAGELSCQACGSSLDLKLCASCEAINAMKAERCHACGAQFMAPINGRMVPVAMTYTIDAPRRRGRRALALFGTLVIAGALVLAYRYYGEALGRALQAMQTPPSSPAPQPAAQLAAHTPPAPVQAAVSEAPKEAPKAAPVKEAPKAAPAKEAPKVAAVAVRPAEARPAPRANRAVVSTHAPATGSTAAVLEEVDSPVKQDSPVVGVSVSLPQLPTSHIRVTHTKAMPNDVALPVASVVARPRTGSSGCSEPAVAFGLCGSNEKREGK